MCGETNAERVRAFHAAMGSPVPAKPHAPDQSLLRLRETLLDEEYDEVKTAIRQLMAGAEGVNAAAFSHLMHELADLLYVTYGAMLACGVDPDPVFAAVHQANMDKTHGPRRADGKQLKPPGWQPADVGGVIARQLGKFAE
ncbi:MAG: hypothetical protein KC418_20720 [Anaerolineales bacterium]|nr:hypothetical protein [Anaerolineales bacterium]MCB8952892.1 hypothetical protein [Ardenticatenales bacterium]